MLGFTTERRHLTNHLKDTRLTQTDLALTVKDKRLYGSKHKVLVLFGNSKATCYSGFLGCSLGIARALGHSQSPDSRGLGDRCGGVDARDLQHSERWQQGSCMFSHAFSWITCFAMFCSFLPFLSFFFFFSRFGPGFLSKSKCLLGSWKLPSGSKKSLWAASPLLECERWACPGELVQVC